MATPLENFELQQPNEALNDNTDPPVLSTTETVPTASESTPNEPVISSTVGGADASNADGVIEKREEAWQVSTMPEEKRFFSLDVCGLSKLCSYPNILHYIQYMHTLTLHIHVSTIWLLF